MKYPDDPAAREDLISGDVAGRPAEFLLRDGVKVPVVFLFLSILGGVQTFGMLGLLYGPMILGLLAVMLTIYGEEYHVVLSSGHNNKATKR